MRFQYAHHCEVDCHSNRSLVCYISSHTSNFRVYAMRRNHNMKPALLYLNRIKVSQSISMLVIITSLVLL